MLTPQNLFQTIYKDRGRIYDNQGSGSTISKERERQFNFAYTSFISIPHDAKTNNTISIADPKDFQMGGGDKRGGPRVEVKINHLINMHKYTCI